MEIPEIHASPDRKRSDGPDPVLLLKAWWEAVGPSLARIAPPCGFDQGRLQIAVPDTRWEAEIRTHLGEVLARLRSRRGLESIRGIDLVLHTHGDSPTPASSGAKPAACVKAPRQRR